MINRILYAASQPSSRPLSRVAIYYASLGAIVVGLSASFPDLADFATQGPMLLPGLGGNADLFEPIGPAGGEVAMVDRFEIPLRLLISLFGALLLMLPVSWVYMGTRTRTGFDQSVVQTMIILPIAVAGIVTIVHDSIALAFSLAGIVAAVRFRNTLKDTADALYIFTAIGVGLAMGIGALGIAATVSVFFNFVVLLLWRCDYGVCPKGGAKLEFSSGLLLESVGVDVVPYGTAAAVSKDKAKKKKKKKSKKAGSDDRIPGDPTAVAAAAPAVEISSTVPEVK